MRLTQIIHGKGKHICIHKIREENYNQILDVGALFSQCLLTHNHKLYKIYKSYSQNHVIFLLYQPRYFPPIPAMISTTEKFYLGPPLSWCMKLVYIVKIGPKGVDIFWEEGEGSSLEDKGMNATYSKQLG